MGPVPPQLEQEVERRQRLGPESAARKALIANSYRPARLEIYNPLQVPGRGRLLGGGGIQVGGLPVPQLVCSDPRMGLWPPSFWLRPSTAHCRAQTSRACCSGWRQCQVRSGLRHLTGLAGGRRVPLPILSASKSKPSGVLEHRGRPSAFTHSLAQQVVT